MKQIVRQSLVALGIISSLLVGYLPVQAESLVVGGCVIEPGTDCTHVGNGLKYKDLVGVDLSGANLSGITLHGSSLRDANLSGADLRNVELDMTELTNANLSRADLSGAFFSLSNITGANLQDANLTDVDLRYAEGARSANLEGAIFCNTTLPDGTIRNDNC
jgi:uncharacterized protein YjbI with pentapeptide repeats